LSCVSGVGQKLPAGQGRALSQLLLSLLLLLLLLWLPLSSESAERFVHVCEGGGAAHTDGVSHELLRALRAALPSRLHSVGTPSRPLGCSRMEPHCSHLHQRLALLHGALGAELAHQTPHAQAQRVRQRAARHQEAHGREREEAAAETLRSGRAAGATSEVP
jgi:hypothetical protein